MKVSWVFDVVSPYAYLAFKRLCQWPETMTVEYVPVLFAGLLSHFGHVGPAEIAPKRRFTYRFVLWRARQLGIPMRWPGAHPFNPLTAQRLIIAAGSNRESVEAVFDAIFAEGRNIQDPQVIDDLASALGIDDARSAVDDPAIKQRLRDNTEWAISYLRNPDLFEDSEMQRLDQLPVGASRRTS